MSVPIVHREHSTPAIAQRQKKFSFLYVEIFEDLDSNEIKSYSNDEQRQVIFLLEDAYTRCHKR